MTELDRALARAKAELRADAARIADTEATLDAVRRDVFLGATPPSNRWRFVAIAAAAILVVGGLVGVSLVQSDDVTPAAPDPSLSLPAPTVAAPSSAPTISVDVTVPHSDVVVPTLPITAPTTEVPSTTTPPPQPIQVDGIFDSYFLDAAIGWLIERRSDTEFQTLHTVDGGTTWTIVDSMPANVTGVLFADPTNGWAIDSGSSMWSTHDGGTTWTQFPTDLTEFLSIDQLALSGNMLYLAGGRDGSDGGIGIDVSPIAADDVTSLDVRIPFGAGPAMDVSMVAQADAVWMVYNDRVVSGSVRILDGVVDTSWVPPAADLGGPVVLHARSEGGPLWAVADAGVWGGDLAIPRSIVYVSDDRGDTFTEVALPPELPSGLGRVVAVPDETSVVISGQIREGPTVFRSSDRGATWQMLSAATFLYTSSLDYVTPDVAFTIQQMDFDPHQELWRSDDGGVTWRTIAIGAPEG